MVLQGCGDCGSWEKNIAVLVPTNSFSHYNGTIPSIVLRVCHFPITRSTFLGLYNSLLKMHSFLETFCDRSQLMNNFITLPSHPKEISCVIFKIKGTNIIYWAKSWASESFEWVHFARPSTDLFLSYFFFDADWVLSTFKKKLKWMGGLVFAMWAFRLCINSLSQTFLLCLKNVHYWWAYFLLCKSH